jgi:hypothetical protein
MLSLDPFGHFFVDNFFRMSFLQRYLRIRNQHQILRCFNIRIAFLKEKIILIILALLTYFECKHGRNERRKGTPFFYKCVLELN